MTEFLSTKRKARLLLWRYRKAGLLSLSVMLSLALLQIFPQATAAQTLLDLPFLFWVSATGISLLLLVSLIID